MTRSMVCRRPRCLSCMPDASISDLIAPVYNRLMAAPARPILVNRLRAALYVWRGRMHRHFGNLSGDRREYQAAVDDFSKAIDLRPIDVPALYSRGVLYWRE